MIPILQDTLKELYVTVIHGRYILKTDIRKKAEEKKQWKAIRNCEFRIRITHPRSGLFESHVPVESITVMVQKRGWRQNGRPGLIQRLWCVVSGRAVLCAEPEIVGTSAELFYAQTKR